MQRFWQADLSRSPDFMLMGDGDLKEDRVDWIQPLDRWTAIVYEHSNVVTINAFTIAVEPRQMVLFQPGSRGVHARTAASTFHKFATFNLPGHSADRVAIPVVSELSETDVVQFQLAADLVGRSVAKGFAFIWQLLWTLAKPTSVFRENASLYAAEDWIRQHIGQKFTITQMAQELDVSQRQLLRLFQIEHAMSVQQYVRETRIREGMRLLADTNLPIKVIASRVGVPDLQHFNKLVREKVGLSPRAVRAQFER